MDKICRHLVDDFNVLDLADDFPLLRVIGHFSALTETTKCFNYV